jgi:hypothetical protein
MKVVLCENYIESAAKESGAGLPPLQTNGRGDQHYAAATGMTAA